MNALDTPPAATRTVAPAHPTHKFRLLLRREFWEHKGGFLWAPLVTGGIFLMLAVMGITIGEVAKSRYAGDARIITDSGATMSISGLDLGMLTDNLSAEDIAQLGNVVDASLFMAMSWPLIVLAFVVFFYCLGALYDERRDRSVLFWKSLPVSDGQTVLSKVASATVVAPLLATAAGIVTMFGFLIVASAVVLLHGGNPMTLLWGPGSPLILATQLAASLPVYAVWALPTVGWLMLCSAWARSKPFLWAIMIPVFAGIFVTWFRLMQFFGEGAAWFWQHVVARLLLSVVPGSDLFYRGPDFVIANDGFEQVHQMISIQTTYAIFARPEIWVGAVAGALMIYAAIQLRRRRELAD